MPHEPGRREKGLDKTRSMAAVPILMPPGSGSSPASRTAALYPPKSRCTLVQWIPLMLWNSDRVGVRLSPRAAVRMAEITSGFEVAVCRMERLLRNLQLVFTYRSRAITGSPCGARFGLAGGIVCDHVR